jgi:hypothetical protein
MNLSIKCMVFCILGTYTMTASADFFYLVLIPILFGWTQKSLLSRDEKLPHPTFEVLVMLVKVLLLIAYTVVNNDRRLYSLTTDRKLAKIIQNSSFHPSSSSSLHISNCFSLPSPTYKECIGLFAELLQEKISLSLSCETMLLKIVNICETSPSLILFFISISSGVNTYYTQLAFAYATIPFYGEHSHIILSWIKRTWSY